MKEPQVCDLASRVKVEIDPEMDAVYPELYAGKVTIVTKQGKRITKRVDYSKGMPENAMNKVEIEAKFRSLATAAIGEKQAETLLKELNATFAARSITPLTKMLSQVRIAESAAIPAEAAA